MDVARAPAGRASRSRHDGWDEAGLDASARDDHAGVLGGLPRDLRDVLEEREPRRRLGTGPRAYGQYHADARLILVTSLVAGAAVSLWWIDFNLYLGALGPRDATIGLSRRSARRPAA